MKFFEKIKNNRKLSEVANLADKLQEMIIVDEIPEELENQYLLVKNSNQSLWS